ncbi:MAG: substrate-binding domain-containing protein [Treponema sp.]|jgi:simple sugar transport system substrate-binding protein|nr:substrate-binding domain-containing protein [Treponema sp.]
MKKSLIRILFGFLVIGAVMLGCTKVTPPSPAVASDSGGFQFKQMKIRFFAGGEAGDAFASVVYKGAMDAATVLKPFGVEVEYVFSGWQIELMMSQLRDAIAARVDAICMMGHPGDDALMPLAEEARRAGIIMMYQNVNVPKLREKYGGGYAGVVDLTDQGNALGIAAINQLGLKPGDRAVVLGAWGEPGRYLREEATAVAFERYGMRVERIKAPPEAASDPQLMLPIITAQLQSYPETKVIVYTGSQLLSAAASYMEANKVKPGDVFNIGFDLSAGVLDGFDKGHVFLTADQQPYLQGFLPIMNAFLTKNFELGSLQIETGAGLVNKDNYRAVDSLVNLGYR